ncbi:MAG: cysteine desulfurase, partial [Spirosomataceae bacterium]
EISDMLLFNLDIAGICASGGSACSSGTNIGSHVLQAISGNSDRPSVRFSFSKYNTTSEVDYAVNILVDLYKKNLV